MFYKSYFLNSSLFKRGLIFFIAIHSLSFGHAQEKDIEQLAVKVCDCLTDKNIQEVLNEDAEVIFRNCLEQTLEEKVESLEENEYAREIFPILLQNCKVVQQASNGVKADLDEVKLSAEQEKNIRERVVGEYDLPNGGGRLSQAGIFLNQDYTFFIYAYATAIFGTWKIINPKIIALTPIQYESPVYIFGSHNPELGERTKMIFMGRDFSNSTHIRLGEALDKNTFTPIRNRDYNCSSFPDSAFFKGIHEELAYVSDLNQWNEKTKGTGEVYSFANPERYNDFVIWQMVDPYENPGLRYLEITQEGLEVQGEKLRREKLNDEEKEFARSTLLAQTQSKEQKVVIYNPSYNRFSTTTFNLEGENAFIPERYTYNSANSTYRVKKEHKDYCRPNDAYENPCILRKYERLPLIDKNFSTFQSKEKSAVYSVCEDR